MNVMKVPVIILSGFLGSGKTTLLLRILQAIQQQNLQAGVLMNELGQQDVDGMILDPSFANGAIEKLLDGCICCSKKSEIEASIHKLLQRQPDLILIELTGVANPEEVVEAMTEPTLMGQVALQRIVTVVNADFFLEYDSILNPDRELKHTLRRQVETADYILINKQDLVTPRTLLKVEQAVRKLNATAPIRLTTNADIEPTYLLKGITALPKVQRKSFHVIPATHDHSATVPHTPSFSKLKTVSLTVQPNWIITSKGLQQLIKSWGKGLLRAKGYVPIEGKLRLVQVSNGQLTIEPTQQQIPPYLVLIGFEKDVLEAKKLVEQHFA
jgi:G3E family GTPase